MRFWEPQIALFQPIPIVVVAGNSNSNNNDSHDDTTYRLATSYDEATHNATRFQCRFHYGTKSITTFSVYPFDYEYVTWRKSRAKAMFDDTDGAQDMGSFWLSSLLFSCPVPTAFQELFGGKEHHSDTTTSTTTNQPPVFHLDLIPIRSPETIVLDT
jgi:hypothetical protein